MFIFRPLATVILFTMAWTCFNGVATPAAAQDEGSCGDLWYQRNAIYARNGYCFKTDRAIRVFGNQGCRFDNEADVPMSRAEREEVERIRAAERRKGCQN